MLITELVIGERFLNYDIDNGDAADGSMGCPDCKIHGILGVKKTQDLEAGSILLKSLKTWKVCKF